MNDHVVLTKCNYVYCTASLSYVGRYSLANLNHRITCEMKLQKLKAIKWVNKQKECADNRPLRCRRKSCKS